MPVIAERNEDNKVSNDVATNVDVMDELFDHRCLCASCGGGYDVSSIVCVWDVRRRERERERERERGVLVPCRFQVIRAR